jgi:GTP 3',8-cyclase
MAYYLRVSLTDRCNLRCVYCLPEDARFAPTRATTAELMRLTEAVVRTAGVDKIRLTGGEPTLCDDLVEHARHAASLVPTVGLTSNGILLASLLPQLRDAGLTRINISLDAVDAEGFRRFARRDGLAHVVASIRAAKRLGFDPVKVNAVAMRTTDPAALVYFAQWEGVHLRFIELMAIGEARALGEAYISSHDLRGRLYAAGISLRERTDRDEPTARVWTIDGCDPAHSTIGFITTVSAPFCATCNRLRLSSQGRLYTCLMDNVGVDLLSPLRAGEAGEVEQRIAAAVAAKAPPRTFVRHENMASIGG